MNQNRHLIISGLLAFIIALSSVPVPVKAQLGSDFAMANQLMRQERYEDALPVLKDLLRENPQSYSVYQRTMECLVNLKKYDEAVDLSNKRAQKQITPVHTRAQLGRLHHLKGDTTKAYNIWEEALQIRPDDHQSYLTVSRMMRERREFNRSVATLEKAREITNNPRLFQNEILNTYLQAGEYENAMGEMIMLIRDNPQRSNYVQRILLRYDDDFLYDIAILQIEETIDDRSLGSESRSELYQLQLWLLLEKDLYRRAYMTAKRYEVESSNAIYTLYNLANKLKSERQFELAAKAYQHYIQKPESPILTNSKFNLAKLYINWGDYLTQKSLGSLNQADSLYQNAESLLSAIIERNSEFNKIDEVIIKKAEIAINRFYDVSEASRLVNKLKNEYNMSGDPQVHYLEGRIKLFNNEFAMARVSFTRAKKKAQIGALAEKSVYYLSLTDFYAGDFEFAKLQLKSLERQHTSNFANDGLKLRMWIQDGLKHDSTGAHLETLASGVKQINKANYSEAYNQLVPFVTTNKYPPLRDNAALLIAQHAKFNTGYHIAGYLALKKSLNQSTASPIEERMMWEQIQLAERIVEQKNISNSDTEPNYIKESLSHFFESTEALETQLVSQIPTTNADIIDLYEELILAYPQGFYAGTARERLRKYQNITS